LTTKQLALRELIEDPAFHSGAPRRTRLPSNVSSRARGAALTSTRRRGSEDPRRYELLAGRIRAMTAKNQEREFNHFLKRLFTEVARAAADGPLQPTPIELPDPLSFRRLEFEPDGVIRLCDSKIRAKFEELYGLLEGTNATRIRECPGCNKLFWARRRDQSGCTRTCANRLRFRRFYKHQR
jgi:hypothetical protein